MFGVSCPIRGASSGAQTTPKEGHRVDRETLNVPPCEICKFRHCEEKSLIVGSGIASCEDYVPRSPGRCLNPCSRWLRRRKLELAADPFACPELLHLYFHTSFRLHRWP